MRIAAGQAIALLVSLMYELNGGEVRALTAGMGRVRYLCPIMCSYCAHLKLISLTTSYSSWQLTAAGNHVSPGGACVLMCPWCLCAHVSLVPVCSCVPGVCAHVSLVPVCSCVPGACVLMCPWWLCAHVSPWAIVSGVCFHTDTQAERREASNVPPSKTFCRHWRMGVSLSRL